MSSERKIVVKDACIFFDLIELDLLDDFFKLGFIVFTSSAVIEEVENDVQLKIIKKCIKAKKVTIDDWRNDEMIYSIFDQNPRLSLTDCTVLELAIRKNGILLSSDKSLRNESKRQNIKVHGILWIIEALCDSQIISNKRAVTVLDNYSSNNLRAPLKKIYALKLKLEG